MQIFDFWNRQKKEASKKEGDVYFHQTEVWHCKLGKNIGDEQDGKGKDFLRPVVIIKKFNKNLFLGVPLTSNLKEGKFYQKIKFTKEKDSNAIISQIRILDSKRLSHKIGTLGENDFHKLIKKIKSLFTFDNFLPPH